MGESLLVLSYCVKGGYCETVKRSEIPQSRITVTEDGREFYAARFRMDDFKKEYPEGRYSTKVVEFKPNSCAVFKAHIYPDQNPDSRPLAEAYCMRWYDAATLNFCEVAETGAIARALANMGYNLCSYELAEGVDPLSRLISLSDGSPYLNVMWRIAWIRQEIPNLYIKKELLSLSDNTALVKVDLMDGEKILATAHASKSYCHNDNGGEYYVDWAETTATGRAISQLGYDLPVDSSTVYDEPSIFSDAPKESYENMNPNLDQVMQEYEKSMSMSDAAQDNNSDVDNMSDGMFNTASATDVELISLDIGGTDPALPEQEDNLTESTGLEELTLDEALAMKPDFGKYAGVELESIAMSGDFEWLLKMATLMKESYPKLATAAEIVRKNYQ